MFVRNFAGLRNAENRELSEIFYIDFNIGACVSRKRVVMEERDWI